MNREALADAEQGRPAADHAAGYETLGKRYVEAAVELVKAK